MSENITESVKTAVQLIKKKGYTGDVYGVEKQVIKYTIKKGEVADSSQYVDRGLGIRVLHKKRIGFGYCVPGKEEHTVASAGSFAGVGPEYVIPFPDEGSCPPVKVYDPVIAKEMGTGKGVEYLHTVLDSASHVASDILVSRGELLITISHRIVANTHDIFLQEKETAVSCGVAAIIPGEKTSLSAVEIASSRKADLNFEEVGRNVAEKVDTMRESAGYTPRECPVVISPLGLSQLIWFTFLQAVQGDNVRKGKSMYQGKLHSHIAAEDVYITDDPTADWGMGSGAFDDEGVISSAVPIVAKGVLTTLLYDLKESVRSNSESTANGMRRSFKEPPEITDRNIRVKGGECNIKDFMEEGGLYVNDVMGAHTANPVNGDFSVVANPVWALEKGEKAGRLDGLMISGNFPELLKNIKLAKDYKKLSFTLGGQRIFSMELPSGLLDGVTISGK
ncbi:MAG: TldD/PmbA family protein [Candidatus Methanofastidiosia archaeon]|jgi:PmbA protein